MDYLADVLGELAVRHLLPVVLDRVIEHIGSSTLRSPRVRSEPRGPRSRPRLALVVPRDTPRWTILSETPGRVRFRVPSLYRNPTVARLIADILAARRGVLTVRSNPRTRSVLVEYDEGELSARDVARVLAVVERRVAPRVPRGGGPIPTGSALRAGDARCDRSGSASS
jgi:hypothetical protein